MPDLSLNSLERSATAGPEQRKSIRATAYCYQRGDGATEYCTVGPLRLQRIRARWREVGNFECARIQHRLFTLASMNWPDLAKRNLS